MNEVVQTGLIATPGQGYEGENVKPVSLERERRGSFPISVPCKSVICVISEDSEGKHDISNTSSKEKEMQRRVCMCVTDCNYKRPASNISSRSAGKRNYMAEDRDDY